MTRRIDALVTGLSIFSLVVLVAGCGKEQPSPPVAAVTAPRAPASATASSAPSSSASPSPAAAPIVTASTDSLASRSASANQGASSPSATPVATADAIEIPFAEEGTPEWRLYEITRLIAPPATRKNVVSADGHSQIVDRTPEEIATERKEKLAQVISHSGQIIAATHANPAQDSNFTNAVHYLSAAHLELALMGDAESARQLGEVAESIFQAKPASVAAVDSASHLVTLARGMAERFGAEDPAWVQAHATQARLFAERFPQEESRAAYFLLEAGRDCETAGQHELARDCYLLLQGRFAETPHADAVAAVLRRMNLQGRTLTTPDFTGPTIDGGYLSVEQYRGRHVLVCFWASDSAAFETDFAQLSQLQTRYGEKLAIIGVNLDVDEAAVDQFLEGHPLRWRQIFDPDPANRGTLNAVARHYGVSSVPLYWLIDPQGVVLAAPADLTKLPMTAE